MVRLNQQKKLGQNNDQILDKEEQKEDGEEKESEKIVENGLPNDEMEHDRDAEDNINMDTEACPSTLSTSSSNNNKLKVTSIFYSHFFPCNLLSRGHEMLEKPRLLLRSFISFFILCLFSKR